MRRLNRSFAWGRRVCGASALAEPVRRRNGPQFASPTGSSSACGRSGGKTCERRPDGGQFANGRFGLRVGATPLISGARQSESAYSWSGANTRHSASWCEPLFAGHSEREVGVGEKGDRHSRRHRRARDRRPGARDGRPFLAALMPANESSSARAILDELVLSRRRMLARERQDPDLLEANRQAIEYWAKRVRGSRAGASNRSASIPR